MVKDHDFLHNLIYGVDVHEKDKAYFWNLPRPLTKDSVSNLYHREYIIHGYRSNYSVSQALVSLLSVHNETMNIWSHLIAFFCVLGAAIAVFVEYETTPVDSLGAVCMGVYLFSAAVCMLLSSVYHWFCCVSTDTYYSLLKMDLSGIAILIAGSFYPGVYYGFYCYDKLQQFYLFVSTLILIAGVCIAWFGSGSTPNASKIRNIGFSSLVALGVVPAAHFYLIAPEELANRLSMGVFLLFICYGTGFCMMQLKFPEKVFSKSFIATHVLSSHTLWHICVFAAVIVWYYQIKQFQSIIYVENFACAQQD